MGKKKAVVKQAQTKKKSEAQSEADSVKKIFDLALLKAKRINEKYDLTKSELFIPNK